MPSERRQSLIPRVVNSNQQGLHPRLDEMIQRHQLHTWRQPIRQHNQAIFESYLSELESGKFIVDAGCGTGQSSVWLAQRYPDKLVLGIDRSEHRLNRKKQQLPSNVRFIRADMEDWWRLLQSAGLQAYKQTIFYPNPYPKASHVQRRWHAHPVFPALVACGGEILFRSNWEIYIREAQRALALHSCRNIVVSAPTDVPVTAFEKKYLENGQALFQLGASL